MIFVGAALSAPKEFVCASRADGTRKSPSSSTITALSTVAANSWIRTALRVNPIWLYDNLGLGQLAMNEGYESLIFDPDSTCAHRFLSDTYIGELRREIARREETFRATFSVWSCNRGAIGFSLHE